MALAAVLIGMASPAAALERSVRIYDERDGLTVAETSELAQDSHGFIWIGTIGGVFRFDGEEIRAWAPVQVRHVVQILATGPDGEVITAGETEPLWRITESGVEAIRGPNGGEIRDWVHATLAGDGALWVASADSLRRLDRGGGWRAWAAADFGGASFYRVVPAGGDSVFVATRGALWIAGGGGGRRPVAPIPLVWLVARLPDRTPVAVTRNGFLWRLDAGGPHLIVRGSGGGIGLAVRDSTIWATIDQFLVKVPPAGPPQRVGPSPSVPAGRPLLVDHEGTLWIGGFTGVYALPEPETVTWNDLDGLPNPAHAHNLARTPGAVWVVTWFGTSKVEFGAAPPRVVPLGSHSGRIRPDPRGRLWAADLDRGFICWDGSRTLRYPRPRLHGLYGTAPRRDGSLWMATDDGLFLAPAGEGPPRLVAARPPAAWPHGWEESWIGPVLEDSRGRLWLGHDEDIWSCDAESLASGLPVAWHDDPIPGCAGLTELVEATGGDVWAGTANLGVMHRVNGRWEALAGNRALGSLRIYGMTVSPRGGIWVLAAGSLVRVVPRPDRPESWEIVERLTSWQGLPTQQASDLCEDPDGRLWLATLAGLVEVPPEARRFEPRPPPVTLVDVSVDGQSQPAGRELRLPWRRNRIELRFAALSFRDRARLRYQVRLGAGRPWREAHDPMLRFVDLHPGMYEADVRASLDGLSWTDPPARLRFRVGRPWWEEWWAVALFVAGLAGLLHAAYRVRVGMLLRLERQRVRIAMDLHDEVGSGLGSIGILAGIAADERVQDSERRRLAARIGETAVELGGSLGDIVRSLRQGVDSLESFGQRLAARAGRLVPGDVPALALHFPERWPAVRLAPELQRQLNAVAMEALHNAVRHAGARTIELGLAPDSAGWRLWVADDGRGMEAAGPATRNGDGGERAPVPPSGAKEGSAGAGLGLGHGLGNMRERAAAIGARLEVSHPPAGGTRLEIRFDPASRQAARINMRTRPGRDPEKMKP